MEKLDYSLAELCIVAGAECFREEGETMITVIGLVPRLAGSLAKASFNPGLLMTDGEYYLVSEPVPVGKRDGYIPKIEGIMNYERVFDIVNRGQRHCLITPVQVDRYGQMNISAIGDYVSPKASLLGVRGYPGNTINNRNSMFIPNHSRRSFVEGEVDVVCSAGYNPERYPNRNIGKYVNLVRIVTNLCVMDFLGVNHAVRLVTLHSGVSMEEVRDNTGFEIETSGEIRETPAPTYEQLQLLDQLDPQNLRAMVFKDNPRGRRDV